MAKIPVETRALPWRSVVCLLLAAFFFYNPFCAFCMSAGPTATVQHHVSYRSTVAACELGCGTVPHTKVDVTPLQVAVAVEETMVRQKDDAGPKPAEETVRVVTQDFAASLWFRPPPSL